MNLKPAKAPAASTHVIVAPMEIMASTGTSALRVTKTSTKYEMTYTCMHTKEEYTCMQESKAEHLRAHATCTSTGRYANGARVHVCVHHIVHMAYQRDDNVLDRILLDFSAG